jgi:hypothetical protein
MESFPLPALFQVDSLLQSAAANEEAQNYRLVVNLIRFHHPLRNAEIQR